MRRIAFITLLLVLLLAPHRVGAQIDMMLSQYMSMPSYYNPGAIGTTSMTHVQAASRQQWVGMPGAPSAFAVAADMPFSIRNTLHGVGIQLYNEKIGLFSTMSITAQYAYKVKLFGGSLSVGLQLGLLDYRFDATKIYIPDSEYHDPMDEGIPTEELQAMTFDMGIGFYYTRKGLFAGLSILHLTGPVFNFDDKYTTSAPQSFYFIAGYNIPIKRTLYELQPSLIVRSVLSTTQVEAQVRLCYNKFITGGIGYRLNDALIIALAGAYKNFTLGYSYDYPLTSIVRATSGSHEVTLGYSFNLGAGKGNSKNKHKSIRIL